MPRKNEQKDNPFGCTMREMLFVHEYVANNRNGSKAALAAKYKNPDVIATRLLKSKRVKSYLKGLTNEALQKSKAKAEDVIHELVIMGMTRIDDIINYDKMANDTVLEFKPKSDVGEKTAAIKKIRIKKTSVPIMDAQGKPKQAYEKTIEMDFNDKKGSLELLGKHMGLFAEKIDLTGGGEILRPIILPDNGRDRDS